MLRPAYHRELFLDRMVETDHFESFLDRVAEGKAGLKRVLVFRGERGIGKSWLLQHLHTLAQDRASVASFLVQFKPEQDEPQPRIDASTSDDACIVYCALNTFESSSAEPVLAYAEQFEQLLARLFGYLRQKGLIDSELPSGSVDELSLGLVLMLKSGLDTEGSILVLLVDSVFEADWKFVKWLEDYLLAPLLALDRVAIVLSGRGRPYPWIHSLLRHPAMPDALSRWDDSDGNSTESAALRDEHLGWLVQLIRTQVTENPFWRTHAGASGNALGLTQEQERRLEEIWRIGQGHQLLTVRLASSEQTDKWTTLKILNDYIEEELLQFLPTVRRPELRRYLEAICVLRHFGEAEAERMVRVYFEIIQQPTTRMSAKEILAYLMRTYLVRWDHNTQYFVDDTIRIAISGWLRLAKRKTWRKLHTEAKLMYEEWAHDYPSFAKTYQASAQVHENALNGDDGAEGEETQPSEQTSDIANASA